MENYKTSYFREIARWCANCCTPQYLLVVYLSFCCTNQVSAQTKDCGLDWALHHIFKNEDTISQRQALAQYENAVQRWLAQPTTLRANVVIPVVVHIVWHNPEENLSDALIWSQIEALNRDYNAQNEDIEQIPQVFRPLLGNVGISFCLAAVDTLGKATTGIVRKQTFKKGIGLTEDLFFNEKGGSNAWDTEHYLNIWVTNLGNFLAGYGTYPSQTPPHKTGVVIDYKYFGINGQEKFGMGRIATHEVAHFLGIKHLWGDDADCNSDDGIEDTPPQKKAYTGCPNFPKKGCSDSEMFMNFMDYVDDPCMFMFTEGQKQRMLATLHTIRSGFINNRISCLNPNITNLEASIYPNPSSDYIHITFKKPPMQLLTLVLFNSLGQVIWSDKIVCNEVISINISSYRDGVYFLRIQEYTQKIVKMR